VESYREEKELYTTGEAAKILGVSFRTIKRWIYSGKISATKTVGGHYRISKEVISRLQSEVEDQFAIDIITFIDQKRIAYFREIQLNMEDRYMHYETRDKLEWLVRQRKINTKYEFGRRWYFPINAYWEAVKDMAEKKLNLIENFEIYESLNETE